jgi:hypothetical protein
MVSERRGQRYALASLALLDGAPLDRALLDGAPLEGTP